MDADFGESERGSVDANIRARIHEGLATADYRKALAGRGVTTVSLDEVGRPVEHRPDGTKAILDGE